MGRSDSISTQEILANTEGLCRRPHSGLGYNGTPVDEDSSQGLQSRTCPRAGGETEAHAGLLPGHLGLMGCDILGDVKFVGKKRRHVSGSLGRRENPV